MTLKPSRSLLSKLSFSWCPHQSCDVNTFNMWSVSWCVETNKKNTTRGEARASCPAIKKTLRLILPLSTCSIFTVYVLRNADDLFERKKKQPKYRYHLVFFRLLSLDGHRWHAEAKETNKKFSRGGKFMCVRFWLTANVQSIWNH